LFISMTISPTWAITLGTAAVLGIVIVAAAYSAASARWPGRLAYLLGGGLAGFLAIAFAPAWPMLAVMGTVLVGVALRD